jgi:hypothetical protein
VPQGGFIIRPAKGYSLDISGGNVMMLAQARIQMSVRYSR